MADTAARTADNGPEDEDALWHSDPDRAERLEIARFGRGFFYGSVLSTILWLGIIAAITLWLQS